MDFSMEIAKKLMLKEINSKPTSRTNLLVSPLSLNLVLNMLTANMTRGDALEMLTSLLGYKTLDDVTTASLKMMSIQCHVSDDGAQEPGTVCIRYDSGEDEDEDEISRKQAPVLTLINGAWVAKDYNVAPLFHDVIKGVYDGDIRFVDFANECEKVIDEVNAWAERASRGLIKQLLTQDSFNKDTLIVLANALYFKARWSDIFSKSCTKDEEFHLLDGTRISVPFMKDSDERQYGAFDGFKVLRLPYGNGSYLGKPYKEFAMYIFLPHRIDGLLDLIRTFGSDPRFLNQDFKLRSVELKELSIPKFKFSSSFDVSEILPLEELEFGDVANMKLLQKAYIEVNEVGTEGAAVTIFVGMGCSLYGPEYMDDRFVADHPFMFMIREETSKLVIFTGAVLDPSSCGD